jgi:hypothetical protein
MTVEIDLTPELASRLTEEAARHGQEPSRYIEVLLEGLLPPLGTTPLYKRDLDEWKRAFREWGEAHRRDTPPIPLEALRRENLYEDRGL